MEHVLGPHGLVVYDSSDPGRQSRWPATCSSRKSSQPGQTARIAAKAGDALVAKGYHAQATLADGTVSVFHLNAERAPIRIEGDTATVGEHTMTLARSSSKKRARIPNISARTSCCGPSCRTRCSRRFVTWRARTSSPISAS